MAKEIIILEKVSDSPLGFRYALWASVPAARQSFYASLSHGSEFKNATALELTAISTGTVAEAVRSQAWVVGTTVAAIQASLQGDFAEYQAEVSGKNNWTQYGAFWDGLTWTAGGVA